MHETETDMRSITEYVPTVVVIAGFLLLLIGGRLFLNRLFGGKVGLSYKKQMLDALHKNGIEIVSPSFVNRRLIQEEKPT